MKGIRYRTWDLVYIAVFAALWGAVETTVGSYLHVWDVPQSGTILTMIGMALLVVCRTFVPKRGATLLTGIVTMFIKMFSLGGVVINPMLAILMEALLAEIAFGAGEAKLGRGILAGALGASWNIIHPFITQGLIAGWGIVRVYNWVVQGGARVFGIPTQYSVLIFLILLAIKPASGVLAGWLGWGIARAVNRRMGRPAIDATEATQPSGGRGA